MKRIILFTIMLIGLTGMVYLYPRAIVTGLIDVVQKERIHYIRSYVASGMPEYKSLTPFSRQEQISLLRGIDVKKIRYQKKASHYDVKPYSKEIFTVRLIEPKRLDFIMRDQEILAIKKPQLDDESIEAIHNSPILGVEKKEGELLAVIEGQHYQVGNWVNANVQVKEIGLYVVTFNIKGDTVRFLSNTLLSNTPLSSKITESMDNNAEEFEDLSNEEEGYRCYWMENRTGKFYWIPAEQGHIYNGRGFRECYLLDSCNGGKGESGGGCYKWAPSPNAKRVDW